MKIIRKMQTQYKALVYLQGDQRPKCAKIKLIPKQHELLCRKGCFRHLDKGFFI